MRNIFRTALLALLAVLALSAIAATAAEAATEGPFYKIAGSRLTEGQSKEVKIRAKSEERKEDYLTFVAEGGWRILCKTQAFAAGAKLLGSTGANFATGEVKLELSGCKVEGDNAGEKLECRLEGERIVTEPLKVKLVYLGGVGRSGKLGAYFAPVTGVVFAKMKFVERATNCLYSAEHLTGSVVAEVDSGGQSVEVGKEPAETTAMELHFPQTEITQVWVEESGVVVGKKPEQLRLYGRETLEDKSILELAGGPSWGVFT